MFQNVLSRESSRRGAAERQRRWRARQRVRRQAEDRLRQRLGRDPTAAEMRAAIEADLERLGLTPASGRADDEGAGMPVGAVDDLLDTTLPDGDEGDDLPSIRAARELRRLVEQRPPPADPTQADGADAGRGVALASVSFELRIAAERDKIFGLLMQRAEEGDASALLFLASRLAPPARPRRDVSLPELVACDLGTSEGTQQAIEVVLRKAAAGGLALDDAQLLLSGLERRLAVAEQAARAEAYKAASEALAARQEGGLAQRVAAARARLAAEAGGGTVLLEAAPEAVGGAG